MPWHIYKSKINAAFVYNYKLRNFSERQNRWVSDGIGVSTCRISRFRTGRLPTLIQHSLNMRVPSLPSTSLHSESRKFVVRFWFHWRPPEGFIFTGGVWKNAFLQFKTFHWKDSDIFPGSFKIPLEGFRYPS